eukprot:621909-Ditylum_brightwellii.AAC.1
MANYLDDYHLEEGTNEWFGGRRFGRISITLALSQFLDQRPTNPQSTCRYLSMTYSIVGQMGIVMMKV